MPICWDSPNFNFQFFILKNYCLIKFCYFWRIASSEALQKKLVTESEFWAALFMFNWLINSTSYSKLLSVHRRRRTRLSICTCQLDTGSDKSQQQIWDETSRHVYYYYLAFIIIWLLFVIFVQKILNIRVDKLTSVLLCFVGWIISQCIYNISGLLW